MSALAASPVRALLLLDSAWYGHHALPLICGAKKPIYVVANLCSDLAGLQQLCETVRAEGQTMMPELSRRYTPATNRLQELIATRIGRPRRIAIVEGAMPAEVSATPDAEAIALESLIGMIDWCRYIARTAPTKISMLNGGAAGEYERVITIEFASSRSGGPGTVAELRFRKALGDTAAAASCSDSKHEIECERGSAVVTSAIDISWSADQGSNCERLATERPDIEVMLDHFTRRVVGGLIPVADLGDVYRSLTLVRAAEESRRTGQPVALNGHA
jgi:predicted dehydrogenase